MRKDQYICDCSDIDDIIVFRDNGTMQVVKVDNKVFVGKDIIHCAVFKKKDDRTIYNMVYKDGQSKRTFMKRFAVTSITRGKEYQLTKSAEGSKILYFTANSNGEAEKITVNLRKLQKLKTLKINIDFADLLIKSKTSVGNLVTKNPVKNIELKSVGISTLSARKIWFDDNVQRLNVEERGVFLGEFKAEDKVLTINQRAEIELKSFEISNHFDDDILVVEKFITNKPISVVYYDGFKKSYFIKRFKINDKITKFNFINAHKDSFLEVVSTDWRPRIEIIFVKERGKKRKFKVIEIDSFISIKGQKAAGNKLSSSPIKEINLLEPLPFEDTLPTSKDSDNVLSESHNEVDQRKDSTGQITLEL